MGDRAADRAAIVEQMYRYARATDWYEPERHRDVFHRRLRVRQPPQR